MNNLSLKTVQQQPFNAEAPLEALAVIPTPTHLFYVRSNFDIPQLDLATWRLRITGAVNHEREFTIAELSQFEPAGAMVLLECAGNGRRRMVPVPSGVAWDLGAVSCAPFSGVSLASVLLACGVAGTAVEVRFTGADSGEVEPGRTVSFEKSVPIATAMSGEVMLASTMNGAPLTPEHGFPLRVLVPRWYAVSSVKWLTEICVLEQPFTGHFQTERYIYMQDANEPDNAAVREMRVRAVIAQPADGDILTSGFHYIRGIAWSGAAAIAAVNVSTDDGVSWHEAELGEALGATAPTPWSYGWNAVPGAHTIMARAMDAAGNEQPREPLFNKLGYGNNIVQTLEVQVHPLP